MLFDPHYFQYLVFKNDRLLCRVIQRNLEKFEDFYYIDSKKSPQRASR